MSRFSLQHTFCMSNLSSRSGTVLNKINEESMLPCNESKTRIYRITCWLVYKTQKEKEKKRRRDVQPLGMEYSQELSLLKSWQITFTKGIFQQNNVCPTSRTLDVFSSTTLQPAASKNIERKQRPLEKTLMNSNVIMNISVHHLRCEHTAGFLNVWQCTKISNRKSFSMAWKNLMEKLNLYLWYFFTTALGSISSYLFWYKHHCFNKKEKKKGGKGGRRAWCWNIQISAYYIKDNLFSALINPTTKSSCGQ